MANPPDSNPKTAVGRLKPSMHAIPPSAIVALGLAMENGEDKYGLMNWRETAVASSVYYDAGLRHFMAWWDGEDTAQDSQVHHLAHVMACCAILLDAEITGQLLDDRPMPGPTAQFIAHLHDQRMEAVLTGAVADALAPEEPVASSEATLADAIDQMHAAAPGEFVSVPNDEALAYLTFRGERIGSFGFRPTVNGSQELADAIDRMHAAAPGEIVPMSAAELNFLQAGSNRSIEPARTFWSDLFHRNKRKETTMATELETIAAAVARSEATSEKALALVQGLSVKIETIRASTTDDNTRAQLLSLATELNAESDKVDAGNVAGAAELVDPAPAAAAPVLDADAATQQMPTPDPVAADPAQVADPAPIVDVTGLADPADATTAAQPAVNPES